MKKIGVLRVKRVKLVDGSLPGFIKTIFFLLRRDDEQEFLGQIVRGRISADVGSVISEEGKLGASGVERLLLGDFFECVAHDGDQHVEHCDLCEKRSTDEDDDRED